MHKMKESLSDIRDGIVLSLAMAFLFGIFAPLELYISNQDTFWFSIYHVFPLFLAVFFGILFLDILLFFVFRFIGKTPYHDLAFFETACIVCSYVQGNYLVGNLPVINGDATVWNQHAKDAVISAILWAVVILALIITVRRFSAEAVLKVIRICSLCMILMMSVTLGLEITRGGWGTFLDHKLNAIYSTKNEMEYSSGKNFIIFLLDRVESARIEKLLDEEPQYQEIFEDFTYYRDAMGLYPRTEFAVPQILTGEEYLNQEPFEDFSNRVYPDSPILAEAEKRGYRIGLYDMEAIICKDDEILKYDNVFENPTYFTSRSLFIKLYWLVIAYRYFPYELKPFINTDIDFNRIRETRGEYEAFNWSDTLFYKTLNSEEIQHTEDPVFKFIHLEGAHTPNNLLEDLTRVHEGQAGYEDKIRASLTVTKAYLDKLKDAGCYDNSVIVIMADHGDSEEGSDNIYATNPMLFIKGTDEHHELRKSMAPVSYRDLPEAFYGLFDGKASDEVFNCKEGQMRERWFYYYPGWHKSQQITEYLQTGKADETETFKPTGNVFVEQQE